MHQLFHDAALAFTYFGAFTMAATVLYVFVYIPLFGDRYADYDGET